MTTKEDINKLALSLSELTKKLDVALDAMAESIALIKKLQEKAAAWALEGTMVDKYKAPASLNDTIAKPKSSISAKRQPVNDIAKSIGLNDRFLFTRELFDDDRALYAQTIAKLNTMSNWKEAEKYIQSVVKHWDEASDTTQLFLSIVQRRYL
jgi:predicted metalloendopeptidase